MNKERLQKLATHLRTIPLEEWDFSRIINAKGTCGCALFQLPKVDSLCYIADAPNEFYSKNSPHVFIGNNPVKIASLRVIKSVAEYFEISEDSVDNIFFSTVDYPVVWCAYSQVTPAMVADKIEELISDK